MPDLTRRRLFSAAGAMAAATFAADFLPPNVRRAMADISGGVQGKLTDKGYFLANDVIPKCPSKYEMNERKKTGETVPHAMPQSKPLEG